MLKTERKFSDEDLYALLSYIGSNPAILFPTLTEYEKRDLMDKIMSQMSDFDKHYFEKSEKKKRKC